jgi:hypothetical protein
MPVLQQEHINQLSPLIYAFEGHPRKTRETHLLNGEKHNEEFLQFIYDGKDNQHPKQFHQGLLVTDAEVQQYKIDKGNSFRLKCFLWVIDANSIKILWEMTSNVKRGEYVIGKPFVCHTNITGENGQAYIGGEMYFCANGNIYVNFSSDRFGVVATEQKRQMAIKYMQDCNYKNIIRTDNNL